MWSRGSRHRRPCASGSAMRFTTTSPPGSGRSTSTTLWRCRLLNIGAAAAPQSPGGRRPKIRPPPPPTLAAPTPTPSALGVSRQASAHVGIRDGGLAPRAAQGTDCSTKVHGESDGTPSAKTSGEGGGLLPTSRKACRRFHQAPRAGALGRDAEVQIPDLCGPRGEDQRRPARATSSGVAWVAVEACLQADAAAQASRWQLGRRRCAGGVPCHDETAIVEAFDAWLNCSSAVPVLIEMVEACEFPADWQHLARCRNPYREFVWYSVWPAGTAPPPRHRT